MRATTAFQVLMLGIVFAGSAFVTMNSEILEGGLFGFISEKLIIPTMTGTF